MRPRHQHIIAPLAVAGIILCGVLLLYQSERVRLFQRERLHVIQQLNTVSARLETELRTRADITDALLTRVVVDPDLDQREFRLMARELLANHQGVKSIQLARNAVVSHIYPLPGNEAAVGLDLRKLPGQADAVRRSISERRTVIAGPLDLVQGGRGFICRTPIFLFREGGTPRFWGFATVVLDEEALFRAAGLFDAAAELDMALRGRDGLGEQGDVFFGAPAIFSQHPAVFDVSLPNGSWRIAAVPKGGWGSGDTSLLLLLVGGVLLAVTAAALVSSILRKPLRLQRALNRYQEIEQSLRLSEEKYRAVVDNANDGIAVAQDGRFRFVNERLTKLFGYTREELLIRPFVNFIHPDDRALVMDRHVQRLRGEHLPPVYDLRALTSDGAVLWLELSAVLIVWDGRPAALLFLNDITERKQAQQALERAMDELESKVRERTAELSAANVQLRESEHKYRSVSLEFHALLDGIADALVHIGPDLRIRWANRAAAAAFQCDADAAIGRSCHELWQGRDRPCDECPVLASFASGRSHRSQVRTPDDRTWEVKTYPLRNENGSIASVIEIAADISERIKLQTETSRNRQLVSLGELAAGVAHELNNPLAGTALCLRELLQPDIDDSARSSLAKVIDAEFKRMKTIVDRLLTFSRVAVTERSAVDLRNTIEGLLILCRYQFAQKQITIRTSFPEEPISVMAEESKLEQVFINIMLNALHAMETGGVLAIEATRGAECCAVSFSDTGCGISSEVLPRIFEPFYTTRSRSGGTGLGLSLSKDIVEQHGGAIEVSSTPGAGAVFTIRLPLSGASDACAAAFTELPAGGTPL